MAEMEGPKGRGGETAEGGQLTPPARPDVQTVGSSPVEAWDMWASIRKALRLPLDSQTGRDFTSLRDERTRLYHEVLEKTDSMKEHPLAGPFFLRGRVIAWLGLLAELAPEGQEGTISTQAPGFREYLKGARDEVTRLGNACEREANKCEFTDDKLIYKYLHEAMNALVSRYEDAGKTHDFETYLGGEIPACIHKENLTAYVNALRKLGVDRAKGWYVDDEGTKYELFSYDRMKGGVMVGMRSSGKAITGLVAVRFLEEYRKVHEPGKTLAQLLDTPFLELCPNFKKAVEDKHRNSSDVLDNWDQITFRHLITHTSGLPNAGEKEREKVYEDLISLTPGPPQDIGLYCNPGFDIVNLALEEIIEREADGLLGAKSLREFAATVLQTGGQPLDIATATIPPTPITDNFVPQGRGMAWATLEAWSEVPEVLKAQSEDVLTELLKSQDASFTAGSPPMQVGGGFWLEGNGLSTLGDWGNFSFIIPQQPRGDRTHSKWIYESLKEGYIIIVRQADAPNIPCDFTEEKKRGAETLLYYLFNQS